MKHRFCTAVLATGLAIAVLAPAAQADETKKGIERYREMMADPFANPGTLYVDRGEELWKKKRGPKNASLEKCDLGLGPGVVKGAFAQLPRYFADTGRVMTMEGRILHCMVTLQGLDGKAIVKKAFSGRGVGGSEMEFLASYVGAQSNGMKFAVKLDHPKEKEAFEVGKKLFYMRSGPFDYSCQSCHAEPGKRIRLQDLPDLTKPEDTRKTIVAWPAYRVSTESVKTMEHRLADCYRQMRMP
ncbi:MAG: sulfur oxidation c-type cytochrome SoxA, partial [Hyphomicrobiaceae bacterium]|nr:sulfur oxidation c-type cytochrome SoxA [Hyphomicrobiaceae bacterium]